MFLFNFEFLNLTEEYTINMSIWVCVSVFRFVWHSILSFSSLSLYTHMYCSYVSKFIKIIQCLIYGQTSEKDISKHTTKMVQYEIKNKQEHEQLSDEFECSSRRRADMSAIYRWRKRRMSEKKERKHTINANHLFAIHTPDNQLINYVI